MLNLVFHAKDDLQRELLAELYKPDVIDDILKESDSVVTRRKEYVDFPLTLLRIIAHGFDVRRCVKMIGALTVAEQITASVG